METKERSVTVPQGITTGLWSQLARDMKRSVAGIVDRRQVVDIDDAGLVRVTSPDPSDPVAHAVARLRNLRMQSGDDVLTIRLGGGELIVGVIPKPDQADDPLPATAFDVDALKSGSIVRVLGADLSTSSSIVTSTIDEFTFTVPAGEQWIVDYTLGIGCLAAANGVRLGMTTPASCSTLQVYTGSGVDNTSTVSDVIKLSGARRSGIVFYTGGGAIGSARVTASVLGSTAIGTVRAQFVSPTSGQAVNVYAGSMMVARRVR
jgi:hypothetical protein